MIPDHDAHVFNPPLWTLTNGSALDLGLHGFFSGLRRWDAVYFLHVARFGYTYENTLAFFPGYPLLFVRPLAFVLKEFLVESNAYLLSSIVINFLLGFLNTCLIFQLGIKYRLTLNHADWSAILYIINPATVFFLAPYSETLFLASQLLGHRYLHSHQRLYALLCFALGASVRSNGIVSFGFVFHNYLTEIYQRKKLSFPVHSVLLCLAPFALVQYYQYREFCLAKTLPQDLINYGRDHQLKMPLQNNSSPWCEHRLPLSYQYVQKTHWNVGFLNYWQWKQIPNFILALPVFLLFGHFLLAWFRLVRQDLWREKFRFLFSRSNPSKKATTWLKSSEFLPHVLYTLFLSLFALLFMHVQVATRFLFSSGPLLYFICADRVKQHDVSRADLARILSTLRKDVWLFSYCLIYVISGICLFSNFLPWT